MLRAAGARRLAGAVALVACLGSRAGGAAEVAPWDGPAVASLAGQLEERTRALYGAVYRQPRPVGDTQRREYLRLRREVRRLKVEARAFRAELARGGGFEETRRAYEALASSARWTGHAGRFVFTPKDVNDLAAEVEALLGRLAPYYEPGAPPPPPPKTS